MATEIAVAITSLQTAGKMLAALIGIRDATKMQGAIFELQRVILEAQTSAIEAREAQSAQVHAIHDLEQEIVRLKAWDSEKQNYELKTVGHGCIAYMLKPAMRGTEPPHWLCANCYSKGEKGFLNRTGDGARRETIFTCGSCDVAFSTNLPAPKWID